MLHTLVLVLSKTAFIPLFIVDVFAVSAGGVAGAPLPGAWLQRGELFYTPSQILTSVIRAIIL